MQSLGYDSRAGAFVARDLDLKNVVNEPENGVTKLQDMRGM